MRLGKRAASITFRPGDRPRHGSAVTRPAGPRPVRRCGRAGIAGPPGGIGGGRHRSRRRATGAGPVRRSGRGARRRGPGRPDL